MSEVPGEAGIHGGVTSVTLAGVGKTAKMTWPCRAGVGGKLTLLDLLAELHPARLSL